MVSKNKDAYNAKTRTAGNINKTLMIISITGSDHAKGVENWVIKGDLLNCNLNSSKSIILLTDAYTKRSINNADIISPNKVLNLTDISFVYLTENKVCN